MNLNRINIDRRKLIKSVGAGLAELGDALWKEQ